MKDGAQSWALVMALVAFVSALTVAAANTLLKWYLDRKELERRELEAARAKELRQLVRDEVAAARGDLLEKFSAQNAITNKSIENLGLSIDRDRETTARMWRAVLAWQKKFEERFIRVEERGQETRVIVDRIEKRTGG